MEKPGIRALAAALCFALVLSPICALADDKPLNINDVRNMLNYTPPTPAPLFETPIVLIPAFPGDAPLRIEGASIPGLVDGYGEIYKHSTSDVVFDYCQQLADMGFEMYDASEYTKNDAPVAIGFVKGNAKIIVTYDPDLWNAILYFQNGAEYITTAVNDEYLPIQTAAPQPSQPQNVDSNVAPLALDEPLQDALLLHISGSDYASAYNMSLRDIEMRDGLVIVRFYDALNDISVRFGLSRNLAAGRYSFKGSLEGGIIAQWLSKGEGGADENSSDENGFAIKIDRGGEAAAESLKKEVAESELGVELNLRESGDGHYAGSLSGKTFLSEDDIYPVMFVIEFDFSAGNS
ncbi:MAG: hypothetical protein LBS72_05760 [Oscillospiraceae bacterium]|jgi:hypothetical protein|nr:hypothetical protein [Oscillospiraceae bacterium]